jgi:hypothetical protein
MELESEAFMLRLEMFADQLRFMPSTHVSRILCEMRQLGDVGAMAADTVRQLLDRGLTNLAQRVLYALLRNDHGMCPVLLAGELGEPLRAVGEALSELERRGYVESPRSPHKTWHAIARP